MSRLSREIEFHDQRYADGIGARPQDHFYVAVRPAMELLLGKVTACVRQGGTGLEVGCATGLHTEELLRVHAYDAYGIDISPAAIGAARERFARRGRQPTFAVMDANRLTFGPRLFDFVFGSGVIHHLELPRAIHEARRVMRPGGRFMFMEPLDTNPLIRLYRRRTPLDRSADEIPLKPEHLAQLRGIFDDVRLDYFAFFTLAAIPFGRWNAVQRKVLAVTHRLDQLLFRIPGAWRLAWMVVIDGQLRA